MDEDAGRAVAELQGEGVGVAPDGAEPGVGDEREQLPLPVEVLDRESGDHVVRQVGRGRVVLLPEGAQIGQQRGVGRFGHAASPPSRARSLARQRLRVGPMLPTGICRSRAIRA